MISGHSHASMSRTPATPARSRIAVNNSLNVPTAISTVIRVASVWISRARACARSRIVTPCTALSNAIGGTIATAAASNTSTCACSTAWVALPVMLMAAAVASSHQKKVCARRFAWAAPSGSVAAGRQRWTVVPDCLWDRCRWAW